MTLMASLSLSGMGEAFILVGAADAAAFEVYIEQVLVPRLHAGQLVFLDNLSIHLISRVRQAIEAKGCHLLFLPGYSPDFSPIEEAFFGNGNSSILMNSALGQSTSTRGVKKTSRRPLSWQLPLPTQTINDPC